MEFKKWLRHVQRMDTNRLPKQALQYKPKERRNIGRPRKRWRDQLHLEEQGTGNTSNPSGTWWWWWWSNKHYECVSASSTLLFCTQIAAFCVVLYCHLLPVWPYRIVLHYLIKGMIFERKNTKHNMRVLIFSTTLSQIFLTLRKIQRDVNINLHTSSCK